MVVQELIPFNTACDEFIAGKYILAEVKIASILKLIAGDEKLKDIVSSCLDRFNFNEAFKSSVIEKDSKLSLTLPTDEKEIIAYTFNLLYKFDSKALNFYDFIAKYFAEEETAGQEFINFAKTCILPFKDAINNIYSKRHILVESNDYQTNYYNKIKTAVRLILNNIDNYKLKMNEKEEFSLLLNSLYQSSDKNDKKLVYALMIGLDYFTAKHKKTRIAYLTLEECFTN